MSWNREKICGVREKKKPEKENQEKTYFFDIIKLFPFFLFQGISSVIRDKTWDQGKKKIPDDLKYIIFIDGEAEYKTHFSGK